MSAQPAPRVSEDPGCSPSAPVVLLVDDEPGILSVCRAYLERDGYAVLQAESGRRALEILAAAQVDVVVTDHAMPAMTGIDLLQRVRDRFPETIRILYTGVADTRIAEAALRDADAFRFLVKPFSGDSLRAAVRHAVAYKELLEQNRRYQEEMELEIQAQAADLARSSAFVEGLLDALPVGVLAVDPGGRVTRANPTVRDVLGIPREEVLDRVAQALGVPCVAREGPGAGAAACRNRQVRVHGADGAARTVLWTCEALREPDGSAGGCILSCTDISDKKELEAQVFLAKQEIEAVFDSITDPTFLMDRHGRIQRANRALASLLHKPFAELLGRPCAAVFGNPEGLCQRCPAREVIASGRPAHRESTSRSGQIFKIHYFPLVEGGKAEGVVVRYQDVTAERELEHRLLQADKMAAVGQLAAGIAHEVNNPVGFILSNLNRLDEYVEEIAVIGRRAGELADGAVAGARDPREAWGEYLQLRGEADLDFLYEDTRAMIGECREGAERIRNIVRDLKTFSHPDAKDLEYADLNRGIESTLNIVWNELKYKCEVVRELGELPRVLCRPQQINQVFMNLLVNAAHAIEERGTVTVRTWAEGDRVFASVSDTGTGIAPAHLERIFEPFFTTKPPGKGTGLGLHLASDIVRAHGGSIRVESAVGQGTTFTVELPVLPPQADRGEGPASP
ncbi:MAG: hypothetical protein Kow0092_03380 [Deferrisomatales bacterium]